MPRTQQVARPSTGQAAPRGVISPPSEESASSAASSSSLSNLATLAGVAATPMETDSHTTKGSSSSSSSSSSILFPRPVCPYLQECPRLNHSAEHTRAYDHGDVNAQVAPSTAPPCPFGPACHRSASHAAQYYHAPLSLTRPITSEFPKPFELIDFGDESKSRSVAKSLREIAMCRVMGAIKEKPDWYTKVFNTEITNKWIAEGMQQAFDLSKRSMKYCIRELQYEAALRDDSIQSAAIDGVYQADQLIPAELKAALVQGIRHLEDVPDEAKDWHPGTNKQVLDLVHPSMYCYVIGESKRTSEEFKLQDALVVQGFGEPEEVEAEPVAAQGRSKFGNRPPASDDYSTSKKYAWLPAEFQVARDGSVTIESYINNLHPIDDAPLYPVLASIFSRFVPMFEKVLTELANPRRLRIVPDPDNWYDKKLHQNDKDSDEEENDTKEDKMEVSEKKEEKEDGEDEDEDEDEDDEYGNENRPLFLPDVPSSSAFIPPSIARESYITLAGRRLQVIVKLANIILTPEQSKYEGGSWHVEGMKNESIVASGIYYYESSNITESRLAFRQAVNEPGYEQGDDRGMREVYGLANEHALNQELGSLITQADRCIAFPNMIQHRVQPFELIDKTKQGIRKILVFFLCDPTVRVISTATVPPQQLSWLSKASSAYHVNLMENTPLIDPLVNIILQQTGLGLMTREKAEEHREQLMIERKYFVSQNNENFHEREFSLCEH